MFGDAKYEGEYETYRHIYKQSQGFRLALHL